MSYYSRNCMVSETEAREIRRREAQRQKDIKIIERMTMEILGKKMEKEETEEKKIDNLENDNP